MGKNLWTEGGEGEPISIYCAANELDEARFVVNRIKAKTRDNAAGAVCAILYRKRPSRVLEGAPAGRRCRTIYGGQRFFEPAGNQGCAGLPAPHFQPQRRCGLRARGQHPDAWHRRSYPRRVVRQAARDRQQRRCGRRRAS